MATVTKVEDLHARIDVLERNRYPQENAVSVIDDSIRRARSSVEHLGMHSAVWKFVPAQYYTWSLEDRAACLNAPSIQYLCKSLLMENKKVPRDDAQDPTNPKFILVIIQYAASLDMKKLTDAIRALRTDVTLRLDDSKFDFRIATQDDNRAITGYEHNSVTPFGLLQPVPIVLSSCLEPLKFFWMGGGHELLKLGMAYSDFCHTLKPLVVADIGNPRTALEFQCTDQEGL